MARETDSINNVTDMPKGGKFGRYGGQFVPEILMPALDELEGAYRQAKDDPTFQQEFQAYQRRYGGRPTPLTFAKRMTAHAGGAKIYLKREDLLHGGAHKFNNVMGQALLAQRMGKPRLIAETGAGQHGTATAMAGAVLGLETEIYMGARDVERQRMNVFRMELMGAKVHTVESGSRTLKDAINAALRDWVRSVGTTHYLIGSVVGPHPYPMIVRDLQSVIGEELHEQILEAEERLPDLLVACVGGGSNAIGTFYPFVRDEAVAFLGVEAAGVGLETGHHAASLTAGDEGVLHGAKTKIIQDTEGQIQETSSIAAGLDYPGVGPEHALYQEIERAEYTAVADAQALEAFHLLSELEGIIPALEPAHAIFAAIERAEEMSQAQVIVVTLSGRGDKDLEVVVRLSERGELPR